MMQANRNANFNGNDWRELYEKERAQANAKMEGMRVRLHANQKQMARMAGVSEIMIRMAEHGNITHPRIAAKLAGAYGMGWEEMKYLVHPKHWGNLPEIVQRRIRKPMPEPARKQDPEPKAPAEMPSGPRISTDTELMRRLAKKCGIPQIELSVKCGWHKGKISRMAQIGYIYESEARKLAEVSGQPVESFTRKDMPAPPVLHEKRIKIDVGEIKWRIQKMGMKQFEISRLMHKSEKYLSYILSKGKARKADLRALADVLGCEMEEITEDADC